MQSKLDILYQKNLYQLAIDLVSFPQSRFYILKAERQSLLNDIKLDSNSNILCDIWTRYGDYLYSKGNYDAAILQFILTIGNLEPSYVIRKYLDAERILNLAIYLEALHGKSLANSNHTTLLLNCYTKLQNTSSLDKFIDSDAKFDIETAIDVCLQGGYVEQALRIAKNKQAHQAYIRILIEEVCDYKKAIKELDEFGTDLKLSLLYIYAETLVKHLPHEMVSVLIDTLVKAQGTDITWQHFDHFFSFHSECYASFLEQILQLIFNFDMNFPQQQFIIDPDRAADFSTCCDSLLSSFVTNRMLLKAQKVLEHPNAMYNSDRALLLCKQHNYEAGFIYVYKKLGLYRELLDHYIENFNKEAILTTCKDFGKDDPQLWLYALDYFAVQDSSTSDLEFILDQIQNHKIASLIQVLDRLTTTPIRLGQVRSHIIKHVKNDMEQLEQTQKFIETYQRDIKSFENKINEIQTKPIVFQNSHCDLCLQNLDLPTIAFLCKHAFHSKCIGDDDQECPKCAPQSLVITELLESHKKIQQTLFMKKVK